jgi:hypothetical protein
MKTNSPLRKKIAALCAAVFLSCIATAQNPVLKVYEDWNTVSGSQNMFQRSVTRSVPGTSNVVIAGATINSNGNYDIFVQKINGSGTVLWSAQYNGAGNKDDVATDIRVASNGEIYVCGTYYKDATDSSNAIVIKYDANGNQRWTNVMNGSGSRNDGYSSLLVSGAVVVAVGTCWSTSNQYDMLTRRMDTAGVTSWTTTADNAGLADGAVSLSSRSGSLFVVGGVQSTSTSYKIATWKINPATGAITTTTLSSSSSIGIDLVTDVQEDASGNVYVAGTVYDVATGFDYKLFKYDVNLALLWSATWNGAANLDDGITGLAIASNGSVIVTGFTSTTSQGKNFATVKYNSAGAQQWVSTFDGGGNDSASCIVINSTDTNKIYVSGYSYNGSTNDYQTIRYNGAGTEIWNTKFNSQQNGNDQATAIALDTLGSVIVTGQNQISPASRIYTTVKYLEKNTMLPQDTVATTSNSFVYTENRGQLLNTNKVQIPQIRYSTMNSNPKLYFADTSVSYVFYKRDTSVSMNDSLARVDMKFVGANAALKIRPMEVRSEISNYYLPRRGGGIEHVQDYNQLVNFNIWNNVDMIFGSNLKGFKYYFICKPGGGGGSYASIDLKYNGADSVRIDGSGQLIIYTKLGKVIQPKAAAWQLDPSGNYTALGWQPSYNLVATNEVKFTGLGSYNTAYALVFAIDWGNIAPASIQSLDWSTFYGGNVDDQLADVDVYQPTGSSFYSGQSSSSNFPTLFAIQSQNGGGVNAVAVKMDSTGHRKYATYYGADTLLPFGSQVLCENGAVDAAGNFVIGGRATANAVQHIQFPAVQPAGAYVDTTVAGFADAFFAEFDPNGFLRWATYYGGTGSSFEDIRDLSFDNSGNLYAVMTGDSLTPHQVLAGAYNDSTRRCGLIIKFNSNLARTWATGFGSKTGSLDKLAVDPATGTLYVTGVSQDTFLPLVNPGSPAYMDSTQNLSDVFISQFNSAGLLTWSTYFGGNGHEYGTGMAIFNSDLYMTGNTTSSNFPFLYSGAYIDSALGGPNDIFVARFKATGARIWSTYYGGTGGETYTPSICTDLAGNIYVGASTNSSNTPTLFLQNMYNDASFSGSGDDGFVIAFNASNQRTWATYFGGSEDEGSALGIATYGNKKLYICGNTKSRENSTVPFPLQDLGGGAYYQPVYGGGVYNGCISRFSIDSIGIWAGINEEQPITATSQSLFVFPNPSGGQFQVTVNADTKNRRIEVYNTLGQVIQTVKLDDGMAIQTISLNLNEQADGIYIVVLKDDTGLCSKKIIKQ